MLYVKLQGAVPHVCWQLSLKAGAINFLLMRMVMALRMSSKLGDTRKKRINFGMIESKFANIRPHDQPTENTH